MIAYRDCSARGHDWVLVKRRPWRNWFRLIAYEKCTGCLVTRYRSGIVRWLR